MASILTHLTLFQNFFSITPPNITENWKSSEKSLKMGEIFKICNFWAISTCNTSKKRIFPIEFIFKQKSLIYLEKSDFFFSIFFFKINHTFFCLKMNSMCKMRFFEVLHVDIAQKLQILKILTIFSDFLVEFQFSLFLGEWWRKNSEKGSNELELKAPFRETWFLG